MDCRDLEQVLHPYLDGELLADERARVEHHLAQCAACARHTEVERSNLTMIRAALLASAPPAPESLRRAVRRSMHGVARRERNRQLLRWAAAAAGVALVAGVGHQQYRSFQRRLYVEDAAERHARQFPLEVQASPERLEGWFSGKLDYRVSVPSFPNARAAGARLLNVRDKQAAYIRYDAPRSDTGQTRHLGLFVFGDKPRDVDVGAAASPDLGTSNGYNVVSWREGDVVYQLVTDLDEQDVMGLLPPATAGGAELGTPPVDAQPAGLQR